MNLMGRKKKYVNCPMLINDNSLINNEIVIARSFAEYFSSISMTIQNNIPQSNLDLLHFVAFNNNTVFLCPSFSDELGLIIHELKLEVIHSIFL